MIKPIRATGLERLELHRLRDRVGRLFAALQEATVAEDPLASETWAPPVDLCEASDAIYVRAEFPGLKADQIQVGLTNTQLRIWGEKNACRAIALSLIFVLSEVMVDSAASFRSAGQSACETRPPNSQMAFCSFVCPKSKIVAELSSGSG